MSGWVAGATLAVGVYSASQQADAAQSASEAQSGQVAAGISEQRRQFNAIRELLAPYTAAGTGALQQQQNILGLGAPGTQAAAYQEFEQSPGFQAMARQGEAGILQSASATGGLRGGNVQGALAQFRPALLNQLISQQYDRLGGLTSIGQNAAAGVGNAGMQTGLNVSNLMQQQGAAQAGGILGQSAANQNMANAIPQALGVYSGLGGRFGSTPTGSSGYYSDPTMIPMQPGGGF
jgi:hypothetical protein